MRAPASFDYSIVRIVPRVEREEFINAGAILFCRTRRWLRAQIQLDALRLHALAPWLDGEEVETRLRLIPLICAGDAAGGEIARLPLADRFYWLTTPRSTIVQPSPVHAGLCMDPETALAGLMAAVVHLPPSTTPWLP